MSHNGNPAIRVGQPRTHAHVYCVNVSSTRFSKPVVIIVYDVDFKKTATSVAEKTISRPDRLVSSTSPMREFPSVPFEVAVLTNGGTALLSNRHYCCVVVEIKM